MFSDRYNSDTKIAENGLDWMVWVEDGYQGHLNKQKKLAEEIQKKFIAEGKMQQADLIFQSPSALPGISANHARLLVNAGIYNIGILRETLKKDLWTDTIPGIGDNTGSIIVYAMYNAEIIDDSFEAYKEASDRKYCFAKYARLREENSSVVTRLYLVLPLTYSEAVVNLG